MEAPIEARQKVQETKYLIMETFYLQEKLSSLSNTIARGLKACSYIMAAESALKTKRTIFLVVKSLIFVNTLIALYLYLIGKEDLKETILSTTSS